MEDIKVFNNDDLFFIAEALNAVKNSLTPPFHVATEFHDNDLYIIWSKISLSANAQIFQMKITLTPSQVKNLASIPVLVHPSPGANRAFYLVQMSALLRFNSVPYDCVITLDELILKASTTSGTNYQRSTGAGFLNSASTIGNMASVFGDGNNFIENDSMVLTSGIDCLNGDSEVDVYILYQIKDL